MYVEEHAVGIGVVVSLVHGQLQRIGREPVVGIDEAYHVTACPEQSLVAGVSLTLVLVEVNYLHAGVAEGITAQHSQ